MLGCSVRNPRLLSANAANRPADVTLAMSARKFVFDPSEIRVKQGQVVELRIVAADRKHGFELRPFGIRAELPEGQPVTVRFLADRSGEFEFTCIVFCGLGHHGMNGKLIVQ
jgi:heme/copper-type cytochrome/quinol oxidase subunit 2